MKILSLILFLFSVQSTFAKEETTSCAQGSLQINTIGFLGFGDQALKEKKNTMRIVEIPAAIQDATPSDYITGGKALCIAKYCSVLVNNSWRVFKESNRNGKTDYSLTKTLAVNESIMVSSEPRIFLTNRDGGGANIRYNVAGAEREMTVKFSDRDFMILNTNQPGSRIRMSLEKNAAKIPDKDRSLTNLTLNLNSKDNQLQEVTCLATQVPALQDFRKKSGSQNRGGVVGAAQ